MAPTTKTSTQLVGSCSTRMIRPRFSRALRSPFFLRGLNGKKSDKYLMSSLWRDSCAMEGAGFFIMVARTRTWVWLLLRHANRYRHMSLEFTQSSSARNSGIFSIAREHQWNFQRRRIEARSSPTFTNLIQKRREHRRNPSPNHDDVGFQKVNNASKPIGQQIQGFPDHFFGHRVSRSIGPRNHLAGHGVCISAGQLGKQRLRIFREFLTGTPPDGRSCCQGFNAAALPTVTRWSVAVDSDVPTFRCRTGPPMIDTPVKNNTRADAGSNACIENIPIAAPRAPLRFRQSCRVGIIVDSHLHVVEPAHFLSQRIVMPDSKIRRGNDDARERIQRPGSTDFYRFDSRSFSNSQKQVLNRGGHRGEAFRRLTGCDHRRPAAYINFSASIYQTSGNLRSSDIYSDDELGCRFHSSRIPLCSSDRMRQSFQRLGARELYMSSKKNASSPTRIGLVWQQSIKSLRYTFDLFASILPHFLVPRVHLLRCEYDNWGESRWLIERRYET